MTAIFRLLALLLPRRIRTRHLSSLVRTFDTRVATARASGGPVRALGVALSEYADLCRSAMGARFGGDPLASEPPAPAGRRAARAAEAVVADARFGVRLLTRQPVFSLAAVLTLALGIGANVAVFSVVWHVLLAPAPYRDAHELVTPSMTGPTTARGRFSPLDLRDLADRSQTLANVASFHRSTRNLTGAGDPARLTGYAVTPNFFDVLGIAPAAGRWFTPEEAPEPVVVLSHTLWTQRFGGDEGAIGREVSLNNVATRVVGVLPPQAELPDDGSFWVPLVWDPDDFDAGQRGAHYLQAVARLRPGTLLEQAQADAAAIGSQLAVEYERTNRNTSITVTDLRAFQVASVRPSLVALAAGVALVLLIACSNLANLLLTRGLARGGEVAVRASLGASRAWIVTQLVVEGLVLSAAGGLLAIVLASWGVRAILQLVPEGLPRLQYVAINLPVFVFLGALTVVTALIFGVIPAWRASRADVGQLTREGGTRSVTAGRGLRRGLAVAQVALAVTLVATAGLLARTLGQLASIDPGFDSGNVLTFNVTLPDPPYDSPASRELLLQHLTNRLAALPGATRASFGFGVPFAAYNSYTSFDIEDVETPDDSDFMANLRIVGPGYFDVLGMRLTRGRAFGPEDAATGPLTAIINTSTARRYFGEADPIGQRLRVHVSMTSDAPRGYRTVVGVVDDAHMSSLTAEMSPEIFLPYPQHAVGSATVVIKTSVAPATLVGAARGAMRTVDPDLAMAQAQPLDALVASSIARQRLAATLLAVFAGIAVILAAVGLYGVFSVGVAQRTREIGIRMALGADRGRVLSLFIGEGLLLTTTGAVLGLIGALGASTLVESLLVGVSPRDPLTLTAATLTLLLVSVAASYLPARRASRTNAAEVLQG